MTMTTIGGTSLLPKQRHGEEISIQVDTGDDDRDVALNFRGVDGIREGRQVILGFLLSEKNVDELLAVLSKVKAERKGA